MTRIVSLSELKDILDDKELKCAICDNEIKLNDELRISVRHEQCDGKRIVKVRYD